MPGPAQRVAAEAGVLLRSVWGGWVIYHPSQAPTADLDGSTSDTSAMRSDQREGWGERPLTTYVMWYRKRFGFFQGAWSGRPSWRFAS
ncbi:hypothetical protein BV882_37365 [Streptomyces sp. 46]|nr:hypothetical protein BV882_37365 [Streptomyces sp. 46]